MKGRNGLVKCMMMLAWIILMVGNMGFSVRAVQSDQSYFVSWKEADQPYLYGSRYQCAYTILEEGTQRVLWSGWNAPEVLNLTDNSGKESAVPAYTFTGEPFQISEKTLIYRKENLDGETGEIISGIISKSIPYASVEEIEEAANQVLGAGSVVNLTVGEAITAAQQAIWKVSYGDRYVSQQTFVSIRGMGEYAPEQFLHPESLMESAEQERTEENIKNLYQYYLYQQDRLAETQLDVSNVRYDVRQQDDGSYMIEVSFEIPYPDAITDLNLTVQCGMMTETEKVSDKQMTLLFQGMEKPEPVELILHGTCRKWKAYQYIPEGEGPILVGGDPYSQVFFAITQAGQCEQADASEDENVFTVHIDNECGELISRNIVQLLISGGMLLVFLGIWSGIRCLCKKDT